MAPDEDIQEHLVTSSVLLRLGAWMLRSPEALKQHTVRNCKSSGISYRFVKKSIPKNLFMTKSGALSNKWGRVTLRIDYGMRIPR